MLRTFTTITLTAVGILFGMQNFDHVPVYLFWGKAINIRLIFVIAIAGTGGYLLRHFIGVAREEVLKKRIYAERSHSADRLKKRKLKDHYDEDEL
ncbi:MAG TPA: hypothetical protein HPP90_01020 [Deltaproteobacteria bacterium]|nr:hypothetical protein [Deltaproteobacteria bacterium]